MKAIFSSNVDVNKTAYLNWRTNNHDHLHNMQVIASGFANSSLSLVRRILETNNRGKEADELIFPILFNANHAIEVYLKSIIWSLNIILGKEKTYDNIHNLKDLLDELQRLEKEHENNADFEQNIDKLEKYIDELYTVIEIQKKDGRKFSDISFSRYTLTREKEPQFYINELENVVVDLENFLEVFSEIFTKLDNLSEHYQQIIEYKNESKSELYYE